MGKLIRTDTFKHISNGQIYNIGYCGRRHLRYGDEMSEQNNRTASGGEKAPTHDEQSQCLL